MPTSCWTQTHYALFDCCEAELAVRERSAKAGPGRSFSVKRGNSAVFERVLDAARRKTKGQ